MASPKYDATEIAMECLAAGALLLLLLPIALMIPLSFEPGDILRFPKEDVSLRWYAEYFKNDAWLASTFVSVKVALGASAVSTLLGTLAAVGMRAAPSSVRQVLLVIVLSPLVLPTIVIAIAIYGVFATLQLTGSIAGLIAAHTILTLPIVLITVSTALADVPAELEYAAASLGASPFTAFITVTVPLIARGMIAGAVLAFMLSFDEVVIGMFLSGGDVVTLPKRMLDGIFYEMTPMLAAVSSLFVLANIVGVMLFLCTRVRIKQ